MFTPVLSEASRLEELFDAWVSAAHDARVAWETWLASATQDRADAYAGYRASLDREEHAALVLAAAVGSRGRGVRTDDLRLAA
jgi:hypothetical protein